MASQRTTWPVRSGPVPPRTGAFTWRPETGPERWDTLLPGCTVVLGPGDARAPASYRSGTGKTQLAAAFAHRLWASGGLDLLVWVEARSRDSIVSGYAGALAEIRVAAPPGKPEAAAARFLTWLSGTGRRWLVVLDGLTDAGDADGLWPHGPSGQVLVTTGLTGLRPKPGPSPATGPAAPGMPGAPDAPPPAELAVAVPAFSQREALSYLSGRLNDDPYQVAGALDLAMVVDCLPAALNLAVTYLLESGVDCRQYRLACDQYRQHLPGGSAADPLTAAWMLAVDRARQFAPSELAWPALRLAAVLGPAGIPGAVLTSSAAFAYVAGRPPVNQQDLASLQAAFGNLHRVGLITVDPDDEARTVSVPAALALSVRQAIGQAELRRAVAAAADALCEAWPERQARAGLEQALRDCATGVSRCDDLALWDGGCHPLLDRIGRSLDDAQMAETAAIYWLELALRCTEYLGPRSPATLAFRERLAAATAAAGRADEALVLRDELVADTDSVLGPIDPQAIAARASLAVALRAAGRLPEAITMCQRVAADSDLVFGPVHQQTRQIMRELGGACADAGRYQDAVGIVRRCLGHCERTIGVMHPETIAVRHHLAGICRRAGRADEATSLYQEALAQAQRADGPASPEAVAAREHLAVALHQACRADDAAAMLEQAISAWRQVPGAGPAETLAARANLAALYCLNGRMKEALPLYESALADRQAVGGSCHPGTLRARWNLAAACHKARRLPDAIKIGEAALGDCEQALGPGDRETLTARANLAHAYHAAGLLKRASAHFDRALRDCEQALGPDDQLTNAVRALRKRYLAGRQGAAPIITPPGWLPGSRRQRRAAGLRPGAGGRPSAAVRTGGPAAGRRCRRSSSLPGPSAARARR